VNSATAGRNDVIHESTKHGTDVISWKGSQADLFREYKKRVVRNEEQHDNQDARGCAQQPVKPATFLRT